MKTLEDLTPNNALVTFHKCQCSKINNDIIRRMKMICSGMIVIGIVHLTFNYYKITNELQEKTVNYNLRAQYISIRNKNIYTTLKKQCIMNYKYVLQSKIKEYDADKTSKADFALESSGGMILRTVETQPYFVSSNKYFAYIWQSLKHLIFTHPNNAQNILQPNISPGNCWAFKGQQGAVIIKLLGKVFISGFTVEHIPKSLSPTDEISSAPKTFSIKGLQNEDIGFEFGTYEYDIRKSPIQHFVLNQLSFQSFDKVLLNITSNWGNNIYTCVYRIRVHGKLDNI